MKISNRGDSKDIDWQSFRYVVFDIPNHGGTYEERYRALGSMLHLCPASFRTISLVMTPFGTT